MNRVAKQRLINTGLAKPALKTASEVVARLGAVQAQGYAGAKWGVAQRTASLTDAQIEKEIDDGSIVRTHILRPTWHFVAAADLGWMLALSAPRVHVANGYWYRWLEVDDAVARRSQTVLAKALRDGKHFTRAELGEALGARRGKQFTYALLEERVTKPIVFQPEAALFELTRRYFTTRGPATVADFAWWSGLTKADAKRGVEMAASYLEHESIDGRSYWFPSAPSARLSASLAHLLPNYDEYFIGLKDRSAFSARLESAGVKPRTDALSGHIIFINGQIVGGWKRALVGRTAAIEPTLLVRLSDAERRAVESAANRLSGFLASPVTMRGALTKEQIEES